MLHTIPTSRRPQPFYSQPVPPAENETLQGKARLGLAMLGLLAAGIDVRTRDLGLGGPASNPLEVLLLVVFLVLLADTVMLPRQPWAWARAAWSGNRWLVMYFLWAMFAAFVGLMKLAHSFFVFRNLLPAFFVFVLLMHSMRSVRDVRIVLLVFLVAAVPNLALGLIQKVAGGPFPIKLNMATTTKMDIDGSLVSSAVSGLFNHPNGLSIFLLPVILVAFGLLLAPGRQGAWRRCFALAVFLSAVVLIYFTRAKGAWAWALYGILMLSLPRVLLAWRGVWLLQLIILTTLITAITLVSLHLGGSFRTMDTRVLLWKTTFFAAQADPFIAIFGSGQFAVWLASAKLADIQYANGHNVFLNQIVHFGIPAAILYMLSFIHGIRVASETYRESNNPEIRWYSKVAFTTLLAIAGQYFFEPVAEASGIATCLFLFMALAAVCHRLSGGVKANS